MKFFSLQNIQDANEKNSKQDELIKQTKNGLTDEHTLIGNNSILIQDNSNLIQDNKEVILKLRTAPIGEDSATLLVSNYLLSRLFSRHFLEGLSVFPDKINFKCHRCVSANFANLVLLMY